MKKRTKITILIICCILVFHLPFITYCLLFLIPPFRDTYAKIEMYEISSFYFQRVYIPGYNRPLVLLSRDSCRFHGISIKKPKTLKACDVIEAGSRMQMSYHKDFERTVRDTLSPAVLLENLKQKALDGYLVYKNHYYPLSDESGFKIDSLGRIICPMPPINEIDFDYKPAMTHWEVIRKQDKASLVFFQDAGLYACFDTDSYNLEGRQLLYPITCHFEWISGREQRRLSRWLNKQQKKRGGGW